MERIDERKLISRAKEGDMEAFEALIRKYGKNIYFLCHGMTHTHQSADDLSQETFIKAYFSLDRFKDGMNFYTWIRRIALNITFNYLDKRKREEPLGERENRITHSDSSHRQESPHEELQRNQMERKFKDALRALPSDQRVVFILRTHENLSYKEISQILNIPQGTVMSRLKRARKKMKAFLSEYL